MSPQSRFLIDPMRLGVVGFLLFLAVDPCLCDVSRANTLGKSEVLVPLNLERCVRSSPHMIDALPALTNTLAKHFGKFRELLDSLQANPAAQAEMLASPEVQALINSGLFNRACESLGPTLPVSHENAHIDTITNATSRLGSVFAELGEQALLDISNQAQVAEASNVLSKIFPFGQVREVSAETPWGKVSTANNPTVPGLRSYTSTLGVDLAGMFKDQEFDTSRAFFRAFWQSRVMSVARNTDMLCTENKCEYNIDSNGELTDSVTNTVSTLLEQLQKLDSTNVPKYDGSCFATFGATSCCRKPFLLNKCGSCAQCNLSYVPESACEEVRELLTDCLLTQYDECSPQLGIMQPVTKSFQVCEDDDPRVACDADRKINFVSFNYGRTDPNAMTTCHTKMSYYTSTCVSPASLNVVKSKCDHQQICPIDDSWFPDPCPGFSKYMTGTYQCVKEFNTLTEKVVASIDASSAAHPAYFTDSSVACLCSSCGWERVRELCIGEGLGCPLCQAFPTNFWRSRACPNSVSLETWSPLLDVKVWGGLTLFLLALLGFAIREGDRSTPEAMSARQFSRLVNGQLVTPKSLADNANMDEHYARALIRKATDQKDDEIKPDDLFNFLDADKNGNLDHAEIERVLYRNYPTSVASIKASNLLRKSHGMKLIDAPSQDPPLTRVKISADSEPTLEPIQSRRVPSFRHLNELD